MVPTPYTVKINADPATIQKWANAELALCFAKGIQKGKNLSHNVVAAYFAPGKYSAGSTFEWKETYGIAANSVPFEQGDVITKTGTQIYPIDLESQNTLQVEDWGHVKLLSDDNRISKGWFGFNPVTKDGSAVIYILATDNQAKKQVFSPCYTDQHAWPPGKDNVEQFLPVTSGIIFLHNSGQTGRVLYNGYAYLGEITFPPNKYMATATFSDAHLQWDVVYS